MLEISEADLIGFQGSRAEHEEALVAGEAPEDVDRIEVEEARRAMREVLAEFVECAGSKPSGRPGSAASRTRRSIGV